MAKKKKFPIFVIVLIVGISLLFLGFSETQFPDLLPFSLVSDQPNVSCDGLNCEWQLAGRSFTSANQVISERIPLDLFDLDQPVVISYTTSFSTIGGAPVKVATTDVSIITIDADGNDLIEERLTTVNEGITDITSFLQGKTGTGAFNKLLELEYTGVTCTSACVGTLTIRSPTTNTVSGVITSFKLKPPEIDETSNALLRQKDFLTGNDIVETATRFAVAESFQLKQINATVITDFTIQIATLDPDVKIKGIIWDLGFDPPARIMESVENFTGAEIGTVLGNVRFTFPVIALLADREVPLEPINYAVGIRVDQNVDQSFTYLQAPSIPETHQAVIDNSPSINEEISFIDHGIIGIDINHDPQKGEELFQIFLEETTEPEPVFCIEIFDPVCGIDGVTYSNSCFAEGAGVEIAHFGECTVIDTMMTPTPPVEDTTIILCEGISPEPPECQETDNGVSPPNADQCGITQVFVNGECKCSSPFVDAGDGKCAILDPMPLPPQLQISQQLPNTFVLLGGVIIVIAVVGMIVRRRA